MTRQQFKQMFQRNSQFMKKNYLIYISNLQKNFCSQVDGTTVALKTDISLITTNIFINHDRHNRQ